MGASLQVREGSVVGGDHPCSSSGLDRHVADRHPTLHREILDRLAPKLDDVPDAPVDTDPGDDSQDDVLGGHAVGQ
ncbi:hypothetical protein BMS3Bbin01_02739 [bacterium BMS3Bbin01]|nr:hypothetical protein BMS3Bbin01_02739 [bacterium BMS3Bbin01]